MAALSNTFQNKFLDFLLRAQPFGFAGTTAAAGTGPANVYVALFTAAPTAAGGGTEVSGNGYARVAVASSLTAWAGTQAAASTAASTGTSGLTSNNATVTFGTPLASWGQVVDVALMDSATGGLMLAYGGLQTNMTVNTGTAPTFAPAALSFSIS